MSQATATLPCAALALFGGALTLIAYHQRCRGVLGLQAPSSLTQEIQTNVGVSAEEASSLAEAINERIFLPIRDEIDRHLV